MRKRVTPETAQRPTATSPATPRISSQSRERSTPPSATASSRRRVTPLLCEPAYSSISPSCPSVGVFAGCCLNLHVEVGRDPPPRRRRGRDAAVSAVLDHGADDEGRLLRRAV